MPTGNGSFRDRIRRRSIAIGGAVAAVTAIAVGAIIGGSGDSWPHRYSTDNTPLAWFLSSRDCGGLPTRGTDATEFCGSVGTLGAPDHCWTLQESSGAAVDSAGSWDLTVNGSPRQGVTAYVPVQGTATTFTDEKAVFFDGADANHLEKQNVTTVGGTNLVSITAILSTWHDSSARDIVAHRQAVGYSLWVHTNGKFAARGDGATYKDVYSTSVIPWFPWVCVTAVLDGTSSNAAKFFVNGADDTSATNDLSGTGSWSGTEDFRVGNLSFAVANRATLGGIARVRIDYAAATLADHRALCGTLWTPPSEGSTGVSSSDTSWTQTGSTKCYKMDDHRAVCVPGGLIGVGFDATLNAYGWPLDGAGAANYITYGHDLCSPYWTFSGGSGTCKNAVDPTGNKYGSTLTLTAGQYAEIGSGTYYTNSATVYPRMWIKCSTGTVAITNEYGTGATGDWDVDCSAVAGEWELIHASHAAVTVNTVWAASSTGGVKVRFTDTSADVWGVTVTETDSLTIIPTRSAGQAVGVAAWEIDNDPAAYYTGTIMTTSVHEITGTCLDVDPSTTIVLDGLNSSNCIGVWEELKLK